MSGIATSAAAEAQASCLSCSLRSPRSLRLLPIEYPANKRPLRFLWTSEFIRCPPADRTVFHNHIVLPEKPADAIHLALASAYRVDFVCTWNLKLIANAFALRRLKAFNEKEGLFTPQVCTPEELLGEWEMATDPILREVYRMKDQFAREYGYDLKKMFERLHEDAKKHPERMVQPAPKTAIKEKRRTPKRKTAE